jgi:hypothetical protein
MKEIHLPPNGASLTTDADPTDWEHRTRDCWCLPIVLELKAGPLTNERVVFHADGELIA